MFSVLLASSTLAQDPVEPDPVQQDPVQQAARAGDPPPQGEQKQGASADVPPPPGVGNPTNGAGTQGSGPQGAGARGSGRDTMPMDDVVVTAEKTEKSVFDSTYSTVSISSRDLRERSYRTTPQALRDIPGIMIQETAVGHGSPYIRGFTSFRNLFLVDGVRLNNSAFRSGPNQYWNTVDPFSLDGIEVVKGPSSVLYGSDAIGGTVNARTANPTFTDVDGLRTSGRILARFGTADDSIIARAEGQIEYGWDDDTRTGVLVGATGKFIDDLTAGADVGEQPETGYDEQALDLKIIHKFDEQWEGRFLYQRVEQNDVPRTHRTVFAVPFRGTSVGSDLQRTFQQHRELVYAQFDGKNLDGFVDEFRSNVSLHYQEETRNRIRGNGDVEAQGFDVAQFGAYLEFVSETHLGRLTYGVEYYRDHVQSFLNRVTSPRPFDGIQGPVADDAFYDLLAVYVQDEIEISDRASVVLGTRFNYAEVDANEARSPIDNSQIGVSDSFSSFVYSARGRVEVVPDQVALFGGVSTGFRAPNLSDLTRFDSARSNDLEIPAAGVDPEFYTQYEIGTKVDTEDVSFQGSFFYTQILDQITRTPTGATSPAGETIVQSGNSGDGFIYGVELDGQVRVTDGVTGFAQFTFLEGRRTTFSGGSAEFTEYLTRLMPLTYQVGLRYDDPDSGRWWAEGRVIRAETADKLSTSDIRDTSRVVPGGTPSYTVLDFGGGVRINDNANLVVRLENLTDVDYRVHGSGQNRPGRSLVFTLETTF